MQRSLKTLIKIIAPLVTGTIVYVFLTLPDTILSGFRWSNFAISLFVAIGTYFVIRHVFRRMRAIKRAKKKKSYLTETIAPSSKCIAQIHFEQEKEHEYLNSVIEKADFMTKMIPRIFKGLGEINLVICYRENAREEKLPTRHHVFKSLNKTMCRMKEMRGRAISFLPTLNEIIDTDLPTVIFVTVGVTSVKFGVQDALRSFKKEHPDVKIYIFCSSLYWRDKYEAIESLINDGIVEKEKIRDDILLSNYEELIGAIQSEL